MPAVVAGAALMVASAFLGPALWFVGMFSFGLGLGVRLTRGR